MVGEKVNENETTITGTIFPNDDQTHPSNHHVEHAVTASTFFLVFLTFKNYGTATLHSRQDTFKDNGELPQKSQDIQTKVRGRHSRCHHNVQEPSAATEADNATAQPATATRRHGHHPQWKNSYLRLSRPRGPDRGRLYTSCRNSWSRSSRRIRRSREQTF